jgi:Undecaprenyl-phosphate galactose phosphotransferase WbaP
MQVPVTAPVHNPSGFGAFLKSLTDRLAAFFGLILLSPLFVVLAYKVRKDGGPAFYGQKRVGQNGVEFKCWKFRSMIVNAEAALEKHLAENPRAREEWNREFKLKDDPRITKIGHFLRRSSLDEIPQLYNVLIGEMSLVGPRPVVAAEIPYYGDKKAHYLSVKPGLTGLWQVSGRNDVSYEERVALDAYYVENQSFWGDIVIILKTVYVVLARKGAY